MKNYIPTIEELQGKPPGELGAIFRKAAEVAGDAKRAEPERAAARKTMEHVRRCITSHQGP